MKTFNQMDREEQFRFEIEMSIEGFLTRLATIGLSILGHEIIAAYEEHCMISKFGKYLTASLVKEWLVTSTRIIDNFNQEFDILEEKWCSIHTKYRDLNNLIQQTNFEQAVSNIKSYAQTKLDGFKQDVNIHLNRGRMIEADFSSKECTRLVEIASTTLQDLVDTWNVTISLNDPDKV